MPFRKNPNATNNPRDELHLPETHTEYPRNIPHPNMKPRSENANPFPYHAARGSIEGTNKSTARHPAALTPGHRPSQYPAVLTPGNCPPQHSARKVSPARSDPQNDHDLEYDLIPVDEVKELHKKVNENLKRNISMPTGKEWPRKKGAYGYDHRGVSPPLPEGVEKAEELKRKEALEKPAGTTRKARANFDGDVGGWEVF